MFIPEGQAKAIIRAAREDPSFIHRLVSEIATKDLGIPEEWWSKGLEGRNAPMRPPYEEWRAMSGDKSKAYIVDQSEIKDKIDSYTSEFDPRFVKEF